MAKKYKKLEAGDGFLITKKGGVINMSCCDCGLVHKFTFTQMKNGNIELIIERNQRATGQRRRHTKYE